MPSALVFLSVLWVPCYNTDTCVNFCRRVAKLAKDKNRARDARLKKAAKEATNTRSFELDPSSETNGGKTQRRSMRKPVALPTDDDNRIDVEPDEEEEDPMQKRIQTRMEAAMHDAESEGTEEPEGRSDAGADADVDIDAEGLDGDFAAYEDDDEELEEISVDDDDEEMKEPEEDEEYSTGIGRPRTRTRIRPKRNEREEEEPLSPENGMTLGNLDYLPDEIFAQAAAAITERVQNSADSKTKEVTRRKKRKSRHKMKSKDLIIG